MARSGTTSPKAGRRQPARGRPDPVRGFRHDHGQLNQRVRDIAALVEQLDGPRAVSRLRSRIARALADLREQLFLHFAREEEGLFPFVTEGFPGLGRTVTSMVAAHDRLCGTLSRLIHEVAVNRDGALARVAPIFARFQSSYDGHSRRERVLLDALGAQMGPDQSQQLTTLVRGI